MQYKDVGGSIIAEGFSHPYPDVHTESWNETPHVLPKRYDAWRDEEVNRIVMNTLGVHPVALERAEIPSTPKREFGSLAPDLDTILTAAHTASIYSTPATRPQLSNRGNQRTHWGDVDQLLSDSKIELAAARQRNKLGTSAATPRKVSPRRLRYLMSPTNPSNMVTNISNHSFGTAGSQTPPTEFSVNYTSIDKLALPTRQQSPAPVDRIYEDPPKTVEMSERAFRPPPPPTMGLLCVGQEVMVPDAGTIRTHAAWVKECAWLVANPNTNEYAQKIAAIAAMSPTTVAVRYQDGVEIDLPRSLFTRDGMRIPPRRNTAKMISGSVPVITEAEAAETESLLSDFDLKGEPVEVEIKRRSNNEVPDPRVKKEPTAMATLDGFKRKTVPSTAQRWPEFPDEAILPISEYMKSQGKNPIAHAKDFERVSDISVPSSSEFHPQITWDENAELPNNMARNIERQFDLKTRQLSDEETTDRNRLLRFRNL